MVGIEGAVLRKASAPVSVVSKASRACGKAGRGRSITYKGRVTTSTKSPVIANFERLGRSRTSVFAKRACQEVQLPDLWLLTAEGFGPGSRAYGRNRCSAVSGRNGVHHCRMGA